MSKANNLKDFMTDIANAIRTKKGTTGTINAQNFSSEIESIETGSNPYTGATATEMAQYLASKYYGAVVKYTGTTGTYTNGRLYKVIQVTSNEYTFEELITPVGSTTKTENGTYDVKEYAEVVVNVASVIEVATADEMTALLVEANVGKVYRFTGTSDETYTNGDLYEVVSE